MNIIKKSISAFLGLALFYTTTTASINSQSSPKTGVTGIGTTESVFGISALVLLFTSRKRRRK